MEIQKNPNDRHDILDHACTNSEAPKNVSRNIQSAFRFRRPSAVQHHEIPNSVWEITCPEDHEEVCARTSVPPSGEKEIADLHLPVPASGGVCGTSAAAHQNGKTVQMYRMAVVEHLPPLANGELSPGPGHASTSSVLSST